MDNKADQISKQQVRGDGYKPSTFVIQFYTEECCEDCCQVIHNHFDCPVCQKEYAGTSIYSGAVYELEENEMHFSCEECGTEFEILNNDDVDEIVIRIKDEV